MDRSWKTPKSVAVESCGFWAAAPIWRKKGVTYILLTPEQLGFVEQFFPQGRRWQVSGYSAKDRKISGYPPHKWLGYSEQPLDAVRDACPIGTSRGDLVVDAVALLDLMAITETYTDKCVTVNGTRIVVALLQAATGREPTGRVIPVEVCEACGGQGSTGDYAQGTGKQCQACDGSGEVRKVPAPSDPVFDARI